MQRHLTHLTFLTAVLLLGGSLPAVAQQPQGTNKTTTQPAPAAKHKLVDINSASRAELKTLPGIGDAEAARIIAARPYPSKAKLAADKVLSMEAYTALKGRIVAVPKAQPKPPPKTKPQAPPAGKP